MPSDISFLLNHDHSDDKAANGCSHSHRHSHSNLASDDTIELGKSNNEMKIHHSHQADDLNSYCEAMGKHAKPNEFNVVNGKVSHNNFHMPNQPNGSNGRDKDDSNGHDHAHHHAGFENHKDHGEFESLLKEMDGKDFAHLIEDMDGYLCELAGAQIRDGLHVLGNVPEGDQMVNMLQALTRLPNLDIPSLRGAVGALFDLDTNKLLENQGTRLLNIPSMLVALADRPLATAGDAIETIDDLVKHLFALLEKQDFEVSAVPAVIDETFSGLGKDANISDIVTTLNFVCKYLVPSLSGTTQEIINLLHALNGGFVPAGPSGSPTRGMAHLLPTGRNFYACDPQSLPSLAAWEVGEPSYCVHSWLLLFLLILPLRMSLY